MAITTLILLLVMAMLLPGVINRVRAVLAGRRGVSLYQHVSNVELLLRKGAVYSPSTTALFKAAPSVWLGTALTAMLLLPLGYLPPLLGFKGDVVLFCYLLAAGRMALVLAAMETASSFEGMGAAREALYGALVEPALFVMAGTLAMVTGRVSFAEMFALGHDIPAQMAVVMVLLCYCIYRILTVEAGRIPVDDPRTHLELTMIHEVMVLDYCGVDLAFITIGGWLKMGALIALAANAIGAMLGGSVVIVIAVMLLLAAAVGVVESMRARNRLSRNTTYILSIVAVALLVFFTAFLLMGNLVL